jgi:hypothetical protein
MHEQHRGEQLLALYRTANRHRSVDSLDDTQGSGRLASALASKTGTFLRKKMGLSGGSGSVGPASRRSKSLTKNHWDEVVFAHDDTIKIKAYERVKLKHPGFLRLGNKQNLIEGSMSLKILENKSKPHCRIRKRMPNIIHF